MLADAVEAQDGFAVPHQARSFAHAEFMSAAARDKLRSFPRKRESSLAAASPDLMLANPLVCHSG
jgi:hypothetical protein